MMIHLCPEALQGGAIARLRDGDVLSLDADAGTLQVQADGPDWQQRELAVCPETVRRGWGRELFAFMRAEASPADQGASVFTASLRETDG